MAFSQKHSGKVFVPWFNTAEWRSVYNFLTSNSQEDMRKALMIIKMWKCRTPLLSAGVEGTLLLLETILSDFDKLSDAQIVQICSVTILRFLNICAANSNKQGNFNRTVQKNEIPKWLIDIRHDIAHDHRLPSKSILELALSRSLDWLIEKYWMVQNQTICDYVVNAENSNSKILESLKTYIRLNMNLYKNMDMSEYDEALMEKINYLVSKRYNKSRTDLRGLLAILEEILKQALSDLDNKKIASKVAEILVDENALLATNIQIDDEGNEMIPKSFRELWQSLLNILYENGEFFNAVLENLLLITHKGNKLTQKVACIWLSDIFNGLLKSQTLFEELQLLLQQNPEHADLTIIKLNLKSKLERKNPEYRDCVEFESLQKLSSIDTKEFEKKILQKSNHHSIRFVEKVLLFNKVEGECRKQVMDVMNQLYGPAEMTRISTAFSSVLAIDDLPLAEEIPVVVDEDDSDVVVVEEERNSGRWNVVENTSMYKNCPLGILPHQRRERNPLSVECV